MLDDYLIIDNSYQNTDRKEDLLEYIKKFCFLLGELKKWYDCNDDCLFFYDLDTIIPNLAYFSKLERVSLRHLLMYYGIYLLKKPMSSELKRKVDFFFDGRNLKKIYNIDNMNDNHPYFGE